MLAGGLRAAAALATIGAGGGLVAACTSGPLAARRTGPSGGTGAGAASPRRGGSLVFGTDAEEAGFDPTYARFDATGVMYARTVYDPLAIPLADGTVVPYLAQSITHQPDYATWTILLRPGVTFHDGSPCDGAALASCLESSISSPLVDDLPVQVAGVSRVGELGVRVRLAAGWVGFPAALTGYAGSQLGWVFSPAQRRRPGVVVGTTLLNTHPIGTGPFVFSEWESGDHFTAVRNPHYWRRGLPYVDSLTYRPLTDVVQRWDDLLGGRIDAMHTDDPRTILAIRGDARLTHVEDAATGRGSAVVHDLDILRLDTDAAPFDDGDLRRAAVLAFDQRRWLDSQTLGVYLPSSGLFPTSDGSGLEEPAQPYDPAAARSIVSAYTAAHGRPPAVTLDVLAAGGRAGAGGGIAADLRAVGFAVSVRPIAPSQYVTDAILGAGSAMPWRITGTVDPDLVAPVLLARGTSGFVTLRTALRDPALGRALAAARAASRPGAREADYRQVVRVLDGGDEVVWLDEAVWSVAARRWVQHLDRPTTPEGAAALPMLSGMIWPTEIWRDGS